MLAAVLGVWLGVDPVVLVSVRGASHAAVDRLLAEGVLPAEGGFARLAREGRRARLVPVDGAVTATAAATLITGAMPARHGITGNIFHRAGTPLDQAASGFEVRPGVETLPEAAVRHGLRVASIGPVLSTGSAGSVLLGRLVEPARRSPYRPARYANAGGSPEFLRAVEMAAGVWPGYADNEALARGDIGREEFVAQAERFRAFKAAAAVHLLQTGGYDLVLHDENSIDNLGHQGFPPETSYPMADRTLAALLDAAPAGARFVVASSHSMAPVKQAVPLNPLLPAGARAYAYGPVAHLRVPEAARAALLARLRAHPSVARVKRGRTPHEGDLVVYARSGLVLTETEAAHRFRFDHGWPHGEPAFFAVRGPGVRRGVRGSVRPTDVAPLVRRLLGIR